MIHYIVCNNPPQGILPTSNGPGMRARQLYQQISAAGHEARFVMFAERFNMTCGAENFAHSHRDLQLVPNGQFGDYVDRIEPGVFIFTQANFPVEVRKAAYRHRIVFDFIARKDLELIEIGKRAAVDKYLDAVRVYLDHADTVLVTSPKLQAHVRAEYGREPILNPFAFSPETHVKYSVPTITFGGRIHKWTNYAITFDGLADYFETHPDRRGLFLFDGGIAGIEDQHAKSVSRLLVLENVTRIGMLPSRQAAEVVGRSHLFVDSSFQGEERNFATSIRTVHALSLGTPVYHNAGTGLDDIYAVFPGKLGPEPDAQALEAVVEDALSGACEQALNTVRSSMTRMLTEGALSW
ncbi:glycosyltransferase involved in cell wall biosynthesis [Breoghania corrubedonensis]|uniref:Glycosyltransferase involved in cell wall biosynthesis n=1 Tax=Breoghania corrubedonensis TaxID=665038 RepID=A0A2T5UW60_9HYPH|nr:glycosyltransferase [Breoghania corrubedonensis]PTW55730.1 glycosyltransferase involved in cell wall biosynthesis [Breoghania corrubedonensis]